ncbi:MAG: hypothetical protein AAFU79_20735 [Myxococcota bacterium]
MASFLFLDGLEPPELAVLSSLEGNRSLQVQDVEKSRVPVEYRRGVVHREVLWLVRFGLRFVPNEETPATIITSLRGLSVQVSRRRPALSKFAIRDDVSNPHEAPRPIRFQAVRIPSVYTLAFVRGADPS